MRNAVICPTKAKRSVRVLASRCYESRWSGYSITMSRMDSQYLQGRIMRKQVFTEQENGDD